MLPGCLASDVQQCTALLLDANGDGKRDILLVSKDYGGGFLYLEQPDGKWLLSEVIEWEQRQH